MSSRNVIITLLFVVALFALYLLKVRYLEPKNEISFIRNPSRVEYSSVALCQMDCYRVSANDISVIIRKGEINKSKTNYKQRPFPLIAVSGIIRNKKVDVEIIQIGRIAKIRACTIDEPFDCDCKDKVNRPV